MTIKGYIPGDYLMSCDRCGFTFRRSQIRRDGNVKGLMVCRSCWDFKATYPSPPPDRIAVPVPRPDNTTVSANNITWNYTSIGDNLFPDPWMVDNLIEYPNDYTKWDVYDDFGGTPTVDGSGNWTIPQNSAVVFYYKDITNDLDTYYTFGGDFELTQGEAVIGTLLGNINISGEVGITSSGAYESTALIGPTHVISGDPEMRFVISNKEVTDVIVKCTNMIGNLGQALTDTDGLWSGGELSQEHVKYYTYSRLVEDTTTSVTVSGLTVGTQYRFMCGLYLDNGYIETSLDGDRLKIFERPQLDTWVEESVLFTAESTSYTLSFTAYGTSYIDGIYFQEYVSEDRFLTTAEILENKKPPADTDTDNTVIPDPIYIEWGPLNLFPDPGITEVPTEFEPHFLGIGLDPVLSRSTTESHSGTHSLKLEWSYIATYALIYAGPYHDVPAFQEDEQYRFKFWLHSDYAWDSVCAYFGSTAQNIILDDPATGVWVETPYYTFTTPETLTNKNIYFGILADYPPGAEATNTTYFDTLELNKYINQTTPF